MEKLSLFVHASLRNHHFNTGTDFVEISFQRTEPTIPVACFCHDAEITGKAWDDTSLGKAFSRIGRCSWRDGGASAQDSGANSEAGYIVSSPFIYYKTGRRSK
jgi:hypothetical protein